MAQKKNVFTSKLELRLSSKPNRMSARVYTWLQPEIIQFHRNMSLTTDRVAITRRMLSTSALRPQRGVFNAVSLPWANNMHCTFCTKSMNIGMVQKQNCRHIPYAHWHTHFSYCTHAAPVGQSTASHNARIFNTKRPEWVHSATVHA